ncbi:MAG: hypothetical protein KGM91_21650 [Burkholderiales bacterium]|nr:hypothetical protein [Burkholderiales bacterium]
MRIFPVALIVVGAVGVARYFGLIPLATLHLVGPIFLIALGLALLWRRPRRACGAGRRCGSSGNDSGTVQPPSAHPG